MIIGYDIDGVVINYQLHLINKIYEMTGIKLNYPCDKFITQIPGVSDTLLNQILKHTRNTAYEAPPIEGAIDSIKKIYNITKNVVLFITARDISLIDKTRNSLENLIGDKFPYEIRHGENKYSLLDHNTKFFVEDDIMQITEISFCVKQGFLVRYPWTENKPIPHNVTRIDNLNEVYEFFENGLIDY